MLKDPPPCPSLLREGSRMLGGYKKLREIVGMSENCRIFAAVKAAIKREKTRKNFEVFRAEAVSNEVQRINNDDYGSKDDDNDRSEEADFENSKVGTGPQVVH